jgi:Trk K+ transport system NAD-binding subunit
LHSPPAADEIVHPGTILIVAGTPESVKKLSEMARPITEEGTIVVIGFGDVGRKLVEILTAVEEEVCVVDPVGHPGVDVVGDILDRDVLERVPLAGARVIVLALDTDSATVFAAAVLRDYAPDLPIIASVSLAENVARVQRTGVDFALSLSQVAGELLARHVLGETISLQPRIKLVRLGPGRLVGKNPVAEGVRERTGCTVVAVERDGQVAADFPASFRLSPDDALYICGTTDAVARYHEEFPASA